MISKTSILLAETKRISLRKSRNEVDKEAIKYFN